MYFCLFGLDWCDCGVLNCALHQVAAFSWVHPDKIGYASEVSLQALIFVRQFRYWKNTYGKLYSVAQYEPLCRFPRVSVVYKAKVQLVSKQTCLKFVLYLETTTSHIHQKNQSIFDDSTSEESKYLWWFYDIAINCWSYQLTAWDSTAMHLVCGFIRQFLVLMVNNKNRFSSTKVMKICKWLLLTWLILPVVIRLSRRLSHACLSVNVFTVKLRMAHYNCYSLLGLFSNGYPWKYYS